MKRSGELQHRSTDNHGGFKEVYATRATGNMIRATEQGKTPYQPEKTTGAVQNDLEEVGIGELRP